MLRALINYDINNVWRAADAGVARAPRRTRHTVSISVALAGHVGSNCDLQLGPISDTLSRVSRMNDDVMSVIAIKYSSLPYRALWFIDVKLFTHR